MRFGIREDNMPLCSARLTDKAIAIATNCKKTLEGAIEILKQKGDN